MKRQFLAFDIGASSGRAVVGQVDADARRFEIHEVYRFTNGAIRLGNSDHWNAVALYEHVLEGLRAAKRAFGEDIESLGIDTWAIDFGLLDRNGRLLGLPYCYRDMRTNGVLEQVTARIPRQRIFAETGGIQFLSFNTLYQLVAMVETDDPLLPIAQKFLLMPDLLNYWLTGNAVSEFTNATTTQFYNGQAGKWAHSLLGELGIPSAMLPKVVLPGTVLGTLKPDVVESVGFANLKVIATASHDTASAAAAIPASSENYAWLSSGTWSLLGSVADAPITGSDALRYNFSSYGGAGGRFLPWKNIMGLWLVQECRRIWAREGDELSFDTLAILAEEGAPFVAFIDPDDAAFLSPVSMPIAIQEYCQRTHQSVPSTKGEILRVAFESLALKYRWTLEKLEIILNKKLPLLHVVGGGAQNKLLCQFAANALDRPVIAGPVEATAIGNIAVQAAAMGAVADLDVARALIRECFDTVTYTPESREPWTHAYAQFLAITGLEA